MKQVVILSGKGGTGKTTVAAALADLASRESRIVLADADVDAGNLELVMSPRRLQSHEFRAGKLAVVDAEKCTGCGLCEEVCRFEAITLSFRGRINRVATTSVSSRSRGGADRNGRRQVDPIACEGCASCFYRCPAGAIRMEEQVAGALYRSGTRFGTLVHAHLIAGQENSGKLVARVKLHARAIALEGGLDYMIVDGPPGIGCPVIASCSGADLALLVAEPTVASIHDLERVLATAAHFGVRSVVCINKHDFNPGRAEEIERFCTSRGVGLVGCIPFDTAVTEAMVRGKTVTEHTDGPVSKAMTDTWARVREEVKRG